ncbi:MAG TPA: DUF3344 domain-containing protein [Methanolinea sp.]|nr:DUF3344 domain-containing protein [Methanolinea sp.]
MKKGFQHVQPGGIVALYRNICLKDDPSLVLPRINAHSLSFAMVSFILLLLSVCFFIASPTTADSYVGGIPLVTVQSGTVTGDLWMDIAPAPDWGSTNVVKTFSLPAEAVGNITWARLYVSAYCGHMQNNYAFSITNRFDGNGDGTYEKTWAEPATSSPSVSLPVSFTYMDNGGNDNSAFPGHGTGEPYKMINDHMNRVTSDYFMWYDVTNMISSPTVNVNVVTTGSSDGRIKVISLLVAYDQPGSNTKTLYWVNQGHDVCSYYTEDNYGEAAVGSTTFGTAGISDVDSATLYIEYLASNNGNYGFPTADNTFAYTGGTPPVEGSFTHPLDRDPDVQGPYSGVDSWDVTSDLTGNDVTFAYARYFPGTGTAAFYKIPLAILVAKRQNQQDAPVAAFTATPTSGNSPLEVSFTDQSTGTITSWAWDFDSDGTVDSTDQNPVHTYQTAGTYTVTLTVTGAGGTSDTNGEIRVNAPSGIPAPIADFSASPRSGTAPLTVQFTDLSNGTITSWAWDFDSDGTVDSTDQNPSYVFGSKGIYAVTLTVAGPGGENSTKKANYIVATAPSKTITADFTADPKTGHAPLPVQFTDTSSGTITSWSWDFDNDGNTDSTDQNPVFVYHEAGSYSVTLTVTGPNGVNTLKKTDFISVMDTEYTCDLSIGGLPTPIGATAFALEPNTVKIFKVGNSGPDPSPETELELKSSDGFTGRVHVPVIEPDDEVTLVITDTTIRSTVGTKVTYTATIDPDNKVIETNENNNVKSRSVEVKYNGYKGARFWGGKDDIQTVAILDLHGDIIHSFGDSQYRSGSFGSGWNSHTVTWTADQLDIPDDATVRLVRLYVPYTWDNAHIAPDKVSVKFNGKTIPYQHWYHDVSNFGAYWDHVYGLLTYNVTGEFKKNDINKVIFSRQGDPLFTKISMYGFTLAVVYEDPDEPRRMIFLNEGFDLLGASEDDYGTTEEEATAYIRFTGPSIDLSDVRSANLITFVASGAAQEPGREGEGNLIVNGKTIAKDVWDYGGTIGVDTGEDGTTQVAVDSRDITDILVSTENEVGIQSTEGITPSMAPIQAFLVVTMDDDSASSSTGGGSSSGGGSSGAGTSHGSSPASQTDESPNQTRTMAPDTPVPGVEVIEKVETSTREFTSSTTVPVAANNSNQSSKEHENPVRPRKRGFPPIIGGIVIGIGSASAIGLYYSIQEIRTRYRYLVAALLTGIILLSFFFIFSVTGGISVPSPVNQETGSGPVSFDALPVIESIRDTNPGNDAPDYPDGFRARNGVLLVLHGPGTVQLKDVEVVIGTEDQKVSLTTSTQLPPERSDPSLSSYLEEVGNGDGILSDGEWLMVYADSCLERVDTETGLKSGAVRWQPPGSPVSVTVPVNGHLHYSVSDRSRGAIVKDDDLLFKDQSQ